MNHATCPIFWLISAEAQAALMAAYYADAGRKFIPPPEPGTAVKYEATKQEDIEQIMKESPRGMRRVD